MVLNERPMKRSRRNRVTADLHDFLSFPPLVAEGQPFRDTVKEFLSTHARITFPPTLFPSLLTWQILFRVGDRLEGADLSPVLVALDVVEEDVTRSARSVYCNQCRVVGWSDNPVCRKRYHFIIRAKSIGSQKSCTKCGNLLHLSESRCKWCDWLVTTDELEEWVYSQFEDNTHLLHGVLHSNGFGHLLLVNGREGGSMNLTGTDIMNFWDRLCTALAVRKVSVMDVSKKYGVEYRLLNAITKGHSWYGNWGYQFGCGSYALTSDSYKKAAETLASVPLGPFLFMWRRPRSHLQAVIELYRSLSVSELLTLKDLFSFLLSLIHKSNKSLPPMEAAKSLEYSNQNILCAWTRGDVEKVQQAMMKVLVAATDNTTWVTTRHTLKGAVCKNAPPELLDYCIKHLKGQLAPNGMLVQARWNSTSSDMVFRLKPSSSIHHDDPNSNYPSKQQVACDLKFLFDSLLHPDTLVNYRPEVTRECVIESATKLLDCKQFMKDYRPDTKIVHNPSAILLLCHVELSDQHKENPLIPPEPLVLHANATIADLKDEASKAFQEVYAMFKRFEADELLEYGSLEDSITLKFLLGHSGSVKVKGSCPSKNVLSHFRRERGTENWTVECMCGAKDDDGERMLACDNCGVWQHTRCVGIDNSDAIPAKFVCLRCMNSYSKDASGRKINFKEASNKVSISKTSSCRGEAAGTDCVGVGAGLTMTFSVG